jgi:predicted transposase YdaD
MLGIELQQTRVYQEAKAEGKAEEGRYLVIKQLTRKLGNLNPQLLDRVNSLPIDRLELLGEALLDFTSLDDLEAWLSQN